MYKVESISGRMDDYFVEYFAEGFLDLEKLAIWYSHIFKVTKIS